MVWVWGGPLAVEPSHSLNDPGCGFSLIQGFEFRCPCTFKGQRVPMVFAEQANPKLRAS